MQAKSRLQQIFKSLVYKFRISSFEVVFYFSLEALFRVNLVIFSQTLDFHKLKWSVLLSQFIVLQL